MIEQAVGQVVGVECWRSPATAAANAGSATGSAAGWLIQGEVFPTSVRGRAAAIGAAVDWVANFLLIEAFPAWQNAWGLAWVMVSFAVLSVVAIGFVFKFLPETKGHSVEEVVQIFEKQAEASKAPV